MSEVTEGSCLCGKVCFSIIGDFEHFFLCHCKYCQKDTGSAHAANLFSTKAELAWRSGEELVRIFKLPNTRHIKSFCVNCGSSLPFFQEESGLLLIPAGSLDNDIAIRPTAHIFMASKANWDRDLDKIKKAERFPE